jgi:hypothetical protein
VIRRAVTLAVLLALAVAASASAQVQKPADVVRVESAVVELAKQKRDSEGHVSARQRAAASAHWGSRYENALDAARIQLKALGGDEGYANYFAFAFRG